MPNAVRKGVKRLRKPKRRLSKKKVATMLLAMSEGNASGTAGDASGDFLSTGRTGRRNALADVLSDHKEVGVSDLPSKLEQMTTNDGASTSKETEASPPEEGSRPSTSGVNN